MKKVLVTGSNGFLGSTIVQKFKDEFEVIAFKRGDDLLAINDIKPNYIIHCAAEIYKDELMFESNISLTYQLLEVAKQLSSLDNFIYIGSSSEYGRKETPMKETDLLEPDTMYEGTKACGSLLTRVYGKTFDFMTSIVRPFSLYGPNEPERKFFPHLYRCFKNNLHVAIGEGVHDWTYIDDFVEGIRLVMLNNNLTGETFHFGTGKQYSNVEVFNIFSDLFNKKLDYTLMDNYVGNQAGVDSNNWVADTTKSKTVLNWFPKYSLERGISKYIEYKEHMNE